LLTEEWLVISFGYNLFEGVSPQKVIYIVYSCY